MTDTLLDWQAAHGDEIDFELSIDLSEDDLLAIQQLAKTAYKDGLNAGIEFALVIMKQAARQLTNKDLITTASAIEKVNPN